MDKALRVLLVEDDTADARLIAVLLAEAMTEPFHLERADRLSGAIARLAKGSIDVVLTDLSLPDATGLECVALIRRAAPDVPIVVLTGQGVSETAIEAVRTGAQDYLLKSEIGSNLLARSIRYAIERHQTQHRVAANEQRLRVLMEQIPAVLWTTDREPRFTSSMGRGLEDLSLGPQDVVGMSLFDYFQTRDPEFLPIAMHRRAIRGEAVSFQMEWMGRVFHTHVEPFRDARQAVIGTIGVAMDVTESRRMEDHLRLAQQIQQHLLPGAPPDMEGIDLAAACYAADACSGDYYDFLPLRGGGVSFAVADVAGHGFGPAILGATARSYLRATAAQGLDVGEMLATVNRLLAVDTRGELFVTLFLARFEPRTRALIYAAAGDIAHVVHRDGSFTVLDSTGMPLGIDPDSPIATGAVVLEPGDIFLAMSDGASEAFSPEDEKFGSERILRVVAENRELPAREILRAIYTAVREHCSPEEHTDDVTLLAMKVL